ncbi:MAG: response regulator [Streptosporangiales bacterium]|nr:response regulator [Streptosporangiales bacterium]MBO0890636.1 response regulator [Acidothermales bacterium]
MIRVLVVDDDFRVADLHASIVRKLPSFEVVAIAHTAAQAVASAQLHRPDLVLLDEYLPDRCGTDVLGDLDGDVLMLSAANDGGTVRRALSGGIVHYLKKPFTPAQLVERLVAYARFAEHLSPQRRLDQAGIDRALAMLRATDATRSRSGEEENLTARRIRDAVVGADEPLTATDVASAIGVSRATAQRHLARLARGGAVRLSLRYGTAGRPEHLYGPL